MEIDDVLANKMMHFTFAVYVPEIVKIQVFSPVAIVLETGHIADWCVQPDIKKLAGFPRNLESEIGSVTTDVPVL